MNEENKRKCQELPAVLHDRLEADGFPDVIVVNVYVALVRQKIADITIVSASKRLKRYLGSVGYKLSKGRVRYEKAQSRFFFQHEIISEWEARESLRPQEEKVVERDEFLKKPWKL